MIRINLALLITVLLLSVVAYGEDPASEGDSLASVQASLQSDIPHVLCLDRNFATGGQPLNTAYAKLKASGYRSVLNLRTAEEGVNLEEEKSAVEKAGMRYVNIPVVSTAPAPAQVKQFLVVVQDKTLQPMLIHCASANRVGAFWMIYRVLVQNWSVEKALQEATQIGLKNPNLKKFALEYIDSRPK
ncbi:MAG: protein tyrosine phosphatase family protein [Terriglobia bacterium]